MAAAGHLGGGGGDVWGLKRNLYLLGLGVFAHYPSPPPPWQIFQILLIFWPKITKKHYNSQTVHPTENLQEFKIVRHQISTQNPSF